MNELTDGYGEPLRIVRTPLRERLLFNTWRAPFPYLFHNWDIVSKQGWWHGFFRKKSAQKWLSKATAFAHTDPQGAGGDASE